MLTVKLSAFKTYGRVVWQLIKTDLAAFRKNLINSAIDSTIYIVLIVASMAYVMPMLGTTTEYGPFVAVAAIPSACLFEMYPLTVQLVADIRGERLISYRLTLPLPTSFVFVAKALAYAIRVSVNAAVGAIAGIAILMAGGRFSTTFFSPLEVVLICIATVLFTGFFSIFTVSLVKNMDRIGSVWNRTIYPLWFLGGSTFSWQVSNNFSETLGIISLANPVLYVMEGMHAATLNPNDYLNFWLCLGMTLLFTMLFGYVGIKRLKKQLNWVS
jgi:ABC-2 type transport system permease protein